MCIIIKRPTAISPPILFRYPLAGSPGHISHACIFIGRPAAISKQPPSFRLGSKALNFESAKGLGGMHEAKTILRHSSRRSVIWACPSSTRWEALLRNGARTWHPSQNCPPPPQDPKTRDGQCHPQRQSRLKKPSPTLVTCTSPRPVMRNDTCLSQRDATTGTPPLQANRPPPIPKR